MRLPVALSTAALLVALLGFTPVGEAAKNLVIPRNSVTTVHIRNGTIQPADLSRQTRAYITAGAPTPRARGVTVATGEHGDKIQVHAPNIRGGNVLAQAEYLGGLTCSSLGPWLSVEATFFDANGVIVETGGDTETAPVVGVRYPIEIFGETSAVRAEVVASVSCL